MANYIGQDVEGFFNGMGERYFYGLRKQDDGSIYLAVVDQMNPNDQITINVPGEVAENYDGFDFGQDFFEGRDVNHEKVFANLKYEQYRWDYQKINYYINDDGILVARLNQPYDYGA